MTILTTPTTRRVDSAQFPRRPRIGTAERPIPSSDSVVLHRWIARQATRYNDLLACIAAAPKPEGSTRG
ncbi:MAG: hypothetical protein AB7I30_14845 [Isosphaeraceae bacterium]